MVARDHEGAFLWGIMGPLLGMNGFQTQLWAIHKAICTAFTKGIPHVEVETDNVLAFDILLDPDEDIVEEEGLGQVIQQINILFSAYNDIKADGTVLKSCRVREIFSTRNWAPFFLAEYGIRNCLSLVEVPSPFGQLEEILDLNNGLGPRLDIFNVQPNFGLGYFVQVAPPSPVQNTNGSGPVSFGILNDLLNFDFGWANVWQNQLMSSGPFQDHFLSNNLAGSMGSQDMSFNSIDPSSFLKSNAGNDFLSNGSVVRPSHDIVIREPDDFMRGSPKQEDSKDKGKGSFLKIFRWLPTILF